MLALLAAPLVLAGCPDWTAYLGGECGSLVGMKGDLQTAPRACVDEDAGPHTNNGCVGGECVEAPGGWSGPTWLWFGPKEQAPACEGESFYEGYGDFVSAGLCEACTCQPPTGSCALPSQLTMSTKACNLPGGSTSSFDAPAEWNGQCDGSTQVPPGVAHSLTVAPIEMVEHGCMVGPPIPAKVIPMVGTTFARACHGRGWSACGDQTNAACIPDDAAPPPGFRLCAFKFEDVKCRPGTSFTERYVFSDEAEEGCVDCACGPPEGSVCKATVSMYENGQCGGPPLLQLPISSVDPVCVDIAPPGQALGSKSAGPTTYVPGTCQPTGGQGNGKITPVTPATFCCRP
jgi:hypothetical protein